MYKFVQLVQTCNKHTSKGKTNEFKRLTIQKEGTYDISIYIWPIYRKKGIGPSKCLIEKSSFLT